MPVRAECWPAVVCLLAAALQPRVRGDRRRPWPARCAAPGLPGPPALLRFVSLVPYLDDSALGAKLDVWNTSALGPNASAVVSPCRPGGLTNLSNTQNIENAELYAVHPYRRATVARGDSAAFAAGRLAWARRRFPKDVGWNQCAMDAALLGNASAAVPLVIARARTPPAKGYRFPAFAPHEQDELPVALLLLVTE